MSSWCGETGERSRPIPWNRAIRWSQEARGMVSGWKGKRTDWRLRSRLMTKKRRCWLRPECVAL